MAKKKERRQNLTITILSLSLLTVMAGAAVAPALNVIQEYFKDENQMFVQMIISIPALFIALTNMIFPKMCKLFKSKELLLVGLGLYIVCGCAAGLFDNIFLILIFRALVGIGVGIIMPMSTGLLSFYYTRDKQDKLMGYSSAMNQMGGVVATLLAGILAAFSWRASFLVYLMGIISVVLVIRYLPDEKIGNNSGKKEKKIFKEYTAFIISMFILMFTFFVYPSSFAIETAKAGIIPMQYVGVIMAGMDLIAFAGGLSFVHIKKHLGMKIKFIAPILFFIGYILLGGFKGMIGTIIGSAFVGFANGLGIPFIISTASQRAGRMAATTVMPMLSIAMYMAQFTTPMILSMIGLEYPYIVAASGAVLLSLLALKITGASKETVIQEK